MKKILSLLFLAVTLLSCNQNANKLAQGSTPPGDFHKFLDQYYEDYLKLFPLAATSNGDNRFNDQLPNDISTAYQHQAHNLFQRYLNELGKYDREELTENDQLSFDILKDQLQNNLDAQKNGLYVTASEVGYVPFDQFVGLPLTIGQMGSGEGLQPFATVKDYDNWLKRLSSFKVWVDTAVDKFREEAAKGIVLPRTLVVKIIPQMRGLVADDPAKSLFYQPIGHFPAGFSAADKKRLANEYRDVINGSVTPAYRKLADFMEHEYLKKARSSSGISALPDGRTIYEFLVRLNTTTNDPPDSIYNLGLREVARIKAEMEKTKAKVGFKGDLKAFFEYMREDPRFMPFKSAKEVLAATENIHRKMEPNLKKMFHTTPKTRFEIRQTEAFRAASASIEYYPGTPDGKRPGIYYIPILDPTKFNITSGMESTFLHEAIPGHHYQISLQQENQQLPRFRRFGGPNAYVEGWALYCESLGKELGLYTDAYQYMGALGDEMHRAIRLVVDVAIHEKGMTCEQAIRYMMENEPVSLQSATAEIERYMAIPGQALSYKVGALKIRELRDKYQKQLGKKFDLADFHDELLKDGAMPLGILERKMDRWAASKKQARNDSA